MKKVAKMLSVVAVAFVCCLAFAGCGSEKLKGKQFVFESLSVVVVTSMQDGMVAETKEYSAQEYAKLQMGLTDSAVLTPSDQQKLDENIKELTQEYTKITIIFDDNSSGTIRYTTRVSDYGSNYMQYDFSFKLNKDNTKVYISIDDGRTLVAPVVVKDGKIMVSYFNEDVGMGDGFADSILETKLVFSC